MIHLTNRELAELVRKTTLKIMELFPESSDDHKQATLRTVVVLLHQLGVLESIFGNPPRGLIEIIQTLAEKEDRPMDLMNTADRQVFGRIAYQMLSPMGVQRCIVVGVPGDGPLFVTILESEHMPKMTPEEAAKILNTLGKAEPGEVLEL